ncbi:hypothetical protein TeGR_g2453 [Tetraparma gracilis]|uniref:Fatty acid hydroxylase domain-containing protein n=1 Tax=Tetraparma gracilis TaxID=2962635 RepID=A0ABQ6N823_9STRA|nr:hypothetical protein TeGR_g2453 [Tetraparma gracilis]
MLKSILEDRNRLALTAQLALCHTVPVLLHQVFMTGIVKLGLFKQYSIQPPAKTPFDQKPALFAKVWFDTALNHLVKIPLAILLALPLLSKRITGMSARDSLTLPPLKTLGLHLLASIVIEDALFYWSHRILHDKWLFKHVHRKHHEFHNLAAYPIASEYTHPVESIVGNVVPTLAGPMLVGCNFATLQLWLVIRMLKTSDAHCGYDFPFSPFGLCWPLNEALSIAW